MKHPENANKNKSKLKASQPVITKYGFVATTKLLKVSSVIVHFLLFFLFLCFVSGTVGTSMLKSISKLEFCWN